MPTHSIYSVRDKKKVDAEVIDVREVGGAKGVRYQIVGRHPEDGTTVTTFCSAAVAEDYRSQLGDTTQHAAESVEVAEDNIPEPEAPVVATDGTPIDDDLDTFVEDPLIGSASEGTLTSAKVLAAEGELSKTSCCCGATEDEPCACMTADEPMQCSSTEPKCACYAALDAKGAETMCPCTNCGCGNGKAAETVAGIDVQTPSQIAIETPDSDELVVPDPDHLVSGDGRVLGQQTGAVNTTPLHAEDDYYECSQCSTHWEDEDEADGCCTSCVNCGLRAHGEHEKAKECCPCDCEPGDCECDESGDCCQDYLDDFDAERDSEYYEAPAFARNKRVLIPTAVIGGLALAYLAKPELLSGSFDKISDMLGKLTKKGDKTE